MGGASIAALGRVSGSPCKVAGRLRKATRLLTDRLIPVVEEVMRGEPHGRSWILRAAGRPGPSDWLRPVVEGMKDVY